MASLRFVKLGSLIGVFLVTVLAVSLLLLDSAVVPISAANIEPLEKHITSPVRLDLTPQGVLLLSDYQSQTVLVLDPLTLSVVRRIKIKGHPLGVAGDTSSIYVGNETSGKVDVFSTRGGQRATLGKASGEPLLPNDIAVDYASGQVFVVDSAARTIAVFDADGQEAGIIPAAGEPGLDAPTALTLDQDAQLLYVSDQGPSVNSFPFGKRNARVRIYRYDGSYVDTLSGPFSRPQGLTLNPDGYLYLADGVLGQVLVFDLLSKTLVKRIGSYGSAPGQLLLPLDVVIVPGTAALLVTSNRAGRIEKFAGGGVAP